MDPIVAPTLPTYQIYALFGGRANRLARSDFFIADRRPADPSPLDFLSWLLVSPERLIAVDTGFAPGPAAEYGIRDYWTPGQVLGLIGYSSANVDTVILTHAHVDHVGNLDEFPNARFYMQHREMAHVCGPDMRFAELRTYYAPEQIAALARLLHEGRLVLHQREFELAPGVSLHWVGGHAAGQEVVRVWTDRGWVVLAADALHYYEEYDRRILFSGNVNALEMLRSHEVIERLADSDDHIVAGHDPLVMEIYPPASPKAKGRVARIDLEPKQRKIR